MTIYMVTTNDKYELPVRVCDTKKEVANFLETDIRSISNIIKYGKEVKGLKVVAVNDEGEI